MQRKLNRATLAISDLVDFYISNQSFLLNDQKKNSTLIILYIVHTDTLQFVVKYLTNIFCSLKYVVHLLLQFCMF